MCYFESLDSAKKFAKDNVTNEVSLRGYNLKVGVIDIDTPIGLVKACVGVSCSSGLGARKPTTSVLFKDKNGERRSQSFLQGLINKKIGRQAR